MNTIYVEEIRNYNGVTILHNNISALNVYFWYKHKNLFLI